MRKVKHIIVSFTIYQKNNWNYTIYAIDYRTTGIEKNNATSIFFNQCKMHNYESSFEIHSLIIDNSQNQKSM